MALSADFASERMGRMPLLRPLPASEHCVGLNVTIYDPDLDPEGTAGALLTDVVVTALGYA